MNFTTQIEQFDQHLWDFHFMVPNEICEHFLNTLKTRRVVCHINSQLILHCALTSDGLGQYFVTFNKENRKILKVGLGDILQVEITEDKSKYGIPCPEEMKELLEIDLEGAQLFHELTPGKQRSLLHIVGKVKSSDLRIKKSMVIIDFLKENQGILDFKELGEAFKMANNKFS